MLLSGSQTYLWREFPLRHASKMVYDDAVMIFTEKGAVSYMAKNPVIKKAKKDNSTRNGLAAFG